MFFCSISTKKGEYNYVVLFGVCLEVSFAVVIVELLTYLRRSQAKQFNRYFPANNTDLANNKLLTMKTSGVYSRSANSSLSEITLSKR